MLIEPAAPEHLDGIRAIAAQYGNLDAWPSRPDPLDFLLGQQGLWVAHDDGAVAGFAGVVRADGVAHLSDLFVAHDRLGGGIGKRLLAAALPRDALLSTYASGDPRALPLYVRAGMRPFAPLLYLEHATGTVPGTPAGAVVGRIALAELPGGRTAARDFLAAAGAYALRCGDGWAVVRAVPGGAHVGPGSAGAGELLALVGAAGAAHGTLHLAVFGPHPALLALLGAGWRVTDMDTYMASAPGMVDLSRHVPDPELG